MAYEPDQHGRLDSLYVKYGARLQSQARSDHELGPPAFAAHDVVECYNDALATAHAVYAYLLSNPPDSPSVMHDKHETGLGA
jgi:hypothetical protein